MTRSFFYSLLLHGLLVLLIVGILASVHYEKKKVLETRCVVLMSHVDVPKSVQSATVKPLSPKPLPPKKPHPRKKITPKKKPTTKPKPMPKKEVMVQQKVPLPKKIEPTVEASESVAKEAVVEEPKEIVVTPHAPAELTSAATEEIATPPTPQSTPEDRYVKAHISEIMALLRKNLYYPRMARKRHMQGRVMLSFELTKEGEIKNITIIEAKKELLGRAAVTTIERLKGKFPLPSEDLVLHVPIMYQLH